MAKKKCNYCEETEGLEHHHIIPRSLGGTDDQCNLLLVCGKHHGILHDMERKSNISELTKEGIRKARAKGKRIGGFTKEAHLRAIANATKTNKDHADEFALSLSGTILSMRGNGKSLKVIADFLNSNNIETDRGGLWYATTVSNLIKRLEALQPS